MSKSVKVVEATTTSGGGIKRHKKNISDYYIFRPKTDAMATKIVEAANTVADNSKQYYYHNGYPWKDKKVTIEMLQSAGKKTGIDCTGLARACLSYALGRKISSGFWPGVHRSDGHKALGDVHDDLNLKYVGSCLLNDVKPGDIITYPKTASRSATNGHVRIVVGGDTTSGGEGKVYVPRLSETSPTKMRKSKWYVPTPNGKNPFTGKYALPNCTAYAWGRFSEIMNKSMTTLAGNAEDWWTYNKKHKIYSYGKEPKLGAIICLKDGNFSGCGHVAVVEKISKTSITISQSGYNSTYFWISAIDKNSLKQGKVAYSGYIFQGFIYNPDIYSGTSDGDDEINTEALTTADMQDRIAKLYASDNYHYLDYDVKKNSLSFSLANVARTLLLKKLNNIIDNAADDSGKTTKTDSTEVVVADDAYVTQYLTALGDVSVPRVAVTKVKGSISNTLELIEAPFIELNLGGYIVGSYMNSLDDFPNHLSSISVKKVNGEINSYTIGLTHLVRTGEDPNVIDKLLSRARYDYVSVRYGDCMSGVVYTDNKVIISNVAMSRDYHSNKISYTIYATSAGSYVDTVKFSFVATTDKPSNVIRDLLYQNPETSAILQEAFPGMQSSAEVDSSGYLPSTDAVVEIPAQANISAIEYINYLTALMGNSTSDIIGNIAGATLSKTVQAVNGVVSAGIQVAKSVTEVSTYFINYFTDHFEIKEVKKVPAETTPTELKSLTNTIYEITVGYPDDNFVMDFSVDTNASWSLLYEHGEIASEYIYSINRDGVTTKTYSPNISSSTNIMNQIEANWWKQMTSFPISATLTLRGLLKPINLMDYVKLNVTFYGQSHYTSGTYVVIGQQDVLSGAGFRTQLSLLRISE